jgi:hypothetical protein
MIYIKGELNSVTMFLDIIDIIDKLREVRNWGQSPVMELNVDLPEGWGCNLGYEGIQERAMATIAE